MLLCSEKYTDCSMPLYLHDFVGDFVSCPVGLAITQNSRWDSWNWCGGNVNFFFVWRCCYGWLSLAAMNWSLLVWLGNQWCHWIYRDLQWSSVHRFVVDHMFSHFTSITFLFVSNQSWRMVISCWQYIHQTEEPSFALQDAVKAMACLCFPTVIILI